MLGTRRAGEPLVVGGDRRTQGALAAVVGPRPTRTRLALGVGHSGRARDGGRKRENFALTFGRSARAASTPRAARRSTGSGASSRSSSSRARRRLPDGDVWRQLGRAPRVARPHREPSRISRRVGGRPARRAARADPVAGELRRAAAAAVPAAVRLLRRDDDRAAAVARAADGVCGASTRATTPRPGVEQIVEHVVPPRDPARSCLLHDGGGDRSQTIARDPADRHTAARASTIRLVTVPELLRDDPPPARLAPPELSISEGDARERGGGAMMRGRESALRIPPRAGGRTPRERRAAARRSALRAQRRGARGARRPRRGGGRSGTSSRCATCSAITSSTGASPGPRGSAGARSRTSASTSRSTTSGISSSS